MAAANPSSRRPLSVLAALAAMAGSLAVLGAFVVSDLAMAGERAVDRLADDPPAPSEVKVKKVVVAPKEKDPVKPAPKSKRAKKSVEFGSFEGY
ncbi:MAG: hypothetical protein SFW67_11055 [Myxococcaceae bacterium]|nr:hypothetical protein [Myxococcaceae bacterium]